MDIKELRRNYAVAEARLIIEYEILLSTEQALAEAWNSAETAEEAEEEAAYEAWNVASDLVAVAKEAREAAFVIADEAAEALNEAEDERGDQALVRVVATIADEAGEALNKSETGEAA